MTREEAIEILEQRLSNAKYVDDAYVDCVDGEALNIAIEALKQPERKHGKWIVRHRHEHYSSGKPYDEDVCPFCKRTDHNGDGLYCGYCGARMEEEQ